MDKPIKLRTNKLIAAAGSASGAIVWARPADRSRPNGNWVASKYYASTVDPDKIKPSDASDATTELLLYRYTNHFLEDGATPHVCQMFEHLRHPNAKANLANPNVINVIKRKSRQAAAAVQSGKEYMILPTFFKPGAISLVDALFPSDGSPALLSERQLAMVIFQVLYTIECMVRTGIMHLDLHLGNVMLYPEPADDTKVRAYEYVSWDLRRELDAHVDAHKFLLHLLTTSGIPRQTRRGTFVVHDAYEWGRSPAGFSPVRKWVQISQLLKRWTSFDSFNACSERTFNLASALPQQVAAALQRDPRRSQTFDAQIHTTYSSCFHYNYPISLSNEVDPSALRSKCVFPRSSKIDLSRAGAGSANDVLQEYAKYNIVDMVDLAGRTVVEAYSIQRLFEAPASPLPGSGKVCPQPKLAGPPLQMNIRNAQVRSNNNGVTDMDVDEPNPVVPQLNLDAGERNEAIPMSIVGTGKTTLITDILYRKREIPAGLVMSGTEDGNSYYRQFIPDTFIYGAYDEDVVQKLIARQKNLKRLNAKHSECFLLLDDCLFNPKILKGDTMRFLFMNGRHFNITLILAAQWVMDIPAAIRANSDYVFVFNDPIVNNRKRFYEHYFGVFRSFQQFEAVYKACTSDFECMVLDNTLQSSNPEDCIFWYKAQIHKPFKLGAPEYWSFHKKCYGQEEDKSSITEVNGVRIRKSK
ncbi:Hypothetical protein KFL_006580060 [Klebsormidium nitens]|uniref:Protein kinase domain-containing protein n=1 Tax=Klebsormidium nitens TaxID=105231 RepID=A0A1Y1IR13_KLENI|nr:Hypothetical protein KFL_006580060 [Klebsormidium nitens]|eukprot:GAQ90578.1 Hypothetical protein KFL_006580060 [Klebsormidium nitens]